MSNNRKYAEARYGALYKRVEGPLNHCFYCGTFADSLDHVPPLSECVERGADFFVNSGIALLKIPSCRECNGLLGARPVYCPLERRQFIHEKLQKRYKKQIAAVKWTSDELEGLSGSLLKYVRAQDDFTQVILRRVAYSAPPNAHE